MGRQEINAERRWKSPKGFIRDFSRIWDGTATASSGYKARGNSFVPEPSPVNIINPREKKRWEAEEEGQTRSREGARRQELPKPTTLKPTFTQVTPPSS